MLKTCENQLIDWLIHAREVFEGLVGAQGKGVHWDLSTISPTKPQTLTLQWSLGVWVAL